MIDFFKGELWLLYVLIVLVGAVALTYSVHLLQQKLKLFKIFIEALYWPLIIFIWIEAISISANLFIDQPDSSVKAAMVKLHKVSLLLLLAWIFIRFINLFENKLLESLVKSEATDRTTIQATGKVLRVAAFIIVALLLLPIVGIEITAIVAFVSGSAIIVGIAAQQVLANYFGGIVVHSDGHFKIGDWIYAPDKQWEGIVEYIGWRSTHIRTLDRRMLYIPNATFSSIIIVNASRMTHRRIQETINICYEDVGKVEKIVEEINTLLQTHPQLDKTQRLAIYCTNLGPFSIKLTLYAFTHTIDWEGYMEIQQAIFLAILDIITQQGAKIAIPNAIVTAEKG